MCTTVRIISIVISLSRYLLNCLLDCTKIVLQLTVQCTMYTQFCTVKIEHVHIKIQTNRLNKI